MSTGSAFIGITTLGNDENSNFVSKLLKKTDKEGSLLFRVIVLKLVCEKCEKAGKELLCPHMMGEIPYWQDEKRHQDIEIMLEDNTDVWLRELR